MNTVRWESWDITTNLLDIVNRKSESHCDYHDVSMNVLTDIETWFPYVICC